MITRTTSSLLSLAAVFILLAASVVALTPGTARAASCVTVVVQGQGQRCVGAGGNGLTVLARAGFVPNTNTPRNPGYVCQINRVPSTCGIPNGNAYWAYFHASPGGSWDYSSAGAGSYTPAAGHCEGWRFETSSTRTVPSARCPAAAPTARPTARPSSGGSGGGSGTRSTPHGTGTGTGIGSPSGTAAGPTPSPTGTGSPTATSTSSASATADPAPRPSTAAAAAPQGTTRNGWAAGAGLALVAVIGGAAAVVARRRSG